MIMKILMPYVNKRINNQIETISAYNQLKDEYTIIRMETKNNDDYFNLLLNNWGVQDLIIWEMDIVANNSNIRALIECPRDICAFNYKLVNGRYICRNADRTPFLDNTEFSDRVGFGFTKISLAVQKIITPDQFKRKSWSTLDTEFSYRMKDLGYLGHIHWPNVKHNHDQSYLE